MTIKAVMFDLDDTLLWDERSVSEAFEATCKAAAAKFPGIDSGELERSVRSEAQSIYFAHSTYPFCKMIGINPFEALWAKFSEGVLPEFRELERFAPGYRLEAWTRGLSRLGVNSDEWGSKLADMFPAERRSRSLIYDDTLAVLDAFRGNYQLLLLTNGAPDLQKEKIAGVPSLASYFEDIVISGQFGKGKPDPAIFQHALGLLGVQADEAIMIGDKLTTDILGSLHTGISNAWLNRKGVSRNDEIVPMFEIHSLMELPKLIESLNP
jgi:putative hydrolase of the HAD superfamily